MTVNTELPELFSDKYQIQDRHTTQTMRLPVQDMKHLQKRSHQAPLTLREPDAGMDGL
jgi:hypothetical protein